MNDKNAERTSQDEALPVKVDWSVTGSVTATELVQRTDNVTWVVENYVAVGGVTLLVAPDKVGKTSMIACFLAAMCGAGTTFAPVAPGHALVVSEEHPQHWKSRIERLGITDNIRFLCRPWRGPPTKEQWEVGVHEWASKPWDLVVVDTLCGCAGVEDENDSYKMQTRLQVLNVLTDAGIAVLLSHHSRKFGGRGGRSVRGSSAITAFSDINLMMSNGPKGSSRDIRRIEATSRYASTPEETLLSFDGTWYHGIQGKTNLWTDCFAVLACATAPMTPAEVAKALDRSESDTQKRLVSGLGNGIYRTRDAGRGKPFLYSSSPVPIGTTKEELTKDNVHSSSSCMSNKRTKGAKKKQKTASKRKKAVKKRSLE